MANPDMDMDMEQDDVEREANIAAPASTLLPRPIANAVSLVTRSSSLYLKLGTFIGGLALDGARITTLTGLELSRAVIEGILHRAGTDVALRSTGELGQAEAEGMLERSIGTLHSTITSISFAASTGFHFSSTILNSASDISQQLLVTLDSILGSSDSSRAIASIITLIRREFQNPATGKEGEKVSVSDLLVGICGLALLQRWCKTITDEECREKKYEEVVWDVVILDDGRRADVVGDKKARKRADSISFVNTNGDDLVQTIQRGVDGDSDDELPEINLKRKIMSTLPSDASVSITTETTTTKTITVEITGAQPPDLSPPPGIEIVEETAHGMEHDFGEETAPSHEQEIAVLVPKYRVVYRIVRERIRGTDIDPKALEFADEAVISDEDQNSPPTRRNSVPGFVLSSISSPISEHPPAPPEKDFPIPNDEVDDEILPDSNNERPSAIPRPKSNEVIANQKRSRKPVSSSNSTNEDSIAEAGKKPLSAKRPKPDRPIVRPTEKKGSFRTALRKGSEKTLSNLWNKDTEPKSTPPKPQWNVGNSSMTPPKSSIPVPQRNSSVVPIRDAPRPPQRGNPNFFSSRDLGTIQDVPRSVSRASHHSARDERRDSLISQTDIYSIQSAETRPGSPTAFRTHLKTQTNMLRARSEKNIVKKLDSMGTEHRRSRSHVPSIYTLQTNMSNNSLVVADQPRKSIFQDSQSLEHLMRTGSVPGLFPHNHLVRNISRFVRFASASYGASFLRIMGITSSDTAMNREIDTLHHHEHHSFSAHTQLPADTILLSSFVDPQGGTDSSGNTNTGVPMVHFVSLDHESKAVVLTCRGTLGFEDVLTDLTADYDELMYRGKAYHVHKGFHASARRLLEGGGGRVMATIAAALEEFPDYGLVLCGHSLGGAVTSLLATLIAEPASDISSSAFFTSSEQRSQLLLTSLGEEGTAPWRVQLPAGRPIHVYAYGPPATMSPSLRLATRGLITTIVNGQDLVPFLSLGVLHDLQAVALAFKTDDSGAKGEVRKRVWAGITGSLADKWYSNRPPTLYDDEDDQWAYSALKTLRASMLSAKLLPPGEVFVVETMPVLQRDTFTGVDEARGLGRPATRTTLKYVRDVEKRFSEVTFGGSMLLDHSPGRYEASLGALRKGVLG